MEKKKVRLTDYDTGKLVALNPDAKGIIGVRALAATEKFKERTAIDSVGHACYLVREPAGVVCKLLGL